MDFYNENQQEIEGLTRQVPPVAPQAEAPAQPVRRRRTERFAGLIDEKDAVPVEDVPQEAVPQAMPVPQEMPVQEAPAPAAETARTSRVPTQVPSQGVPRPAALSGREPIRAVEPQERCDNVHVLNLRDIAQQRRRVAQQCRHHGFGNQVLCPADRYFACEGYTTTDG